MKNVRSIVVATDLAGESDPVVRAAAALAELAGAELHVLHAFDMEIAPYSKNPTLDEWVRGAERDLAEQLRRALPRTVSPTSQAVVVERAHKAILARADAVSADLIVIGRHRARPAGDAFLGSTADRVIRTAGVPCLVVGTALSLPLRRVLVPHDLSEHALTALDVGLEWSASLRPSADRPDGGAELTVLHVIPRVFDVDGVHFDTAVIGPELERKVGEARGRADGAGDVVVREEVRWGDRPAEEIVRFAEEESSDLIVLGTHGHGALKRFLIGSVASGVTRGAPCPVLLVPWKDARR